MKSNEAEHTEERCRGWGWCRSGDGWLAARGFEQAKILEQELGGRGRCKRLLFANRRWNATFGVCCPLKKSDFH